MPQEKHFVIAGGSVVSSSGYGRQCISGKIYSGESCQELLQKTAGLFPGLNTAKKTMRSGIVSLRSICAAILAYNDAGITDSFSDTAIVGIGKEGSFSGNQVYWDDYVKNGKKEGQAKLFVGTLASTPICEIAIVFNLHGAVYYLDPANETLSFAKEMNILFSLGYTTILLLHNTGNTSMAAILRIDTGVQVSANELRQLWGISL